MRTSFVEHVHSLVYLLQPVQTRTMLPSVLISTAFFLHLLQRTNSDTHCFCRLTCSKAPRPSPSGCSPWRTSLSCLPPGSARRLLSVHTGASWRPRASDTWRCRLAELLRLPCSPGRPSAGTPLPPSLGSSKPFLL